MNQKTEMAAIGLDETVLIYNALGIKTFVIKQADEADNIIFKLVNQKFKIIFVSEAIYSHIPETLEKYQSLPFPMILPLPMEQASAGIGLKKIQDNVEKAIGINIF
ncbi:MAG TPA: V-type ATP synthase subunit F [Bacilli bacterium]|nr:MAG: V-type sodium ATPase subunit G [Tenericutes bacterium ADurb.BinA124]HNZ50773.1 V-type ATP synthase subunit F [Bacilli bacterium]HOH18175.1 V-type ATP synthase subunit F [Bacilli bacterium]HPN60779.1 V-type ATP synthase subunit F [Bacilli bacterium]HPX84440.1 V-type ATP synthase subunit F [Bacilli bacterium]